MIVAPVLCLRRAQSGRNQQLRSIEDIPSCFRLLRSAKVVNQEITACIRT